MLLRESAPEGVCFAWWPVRTVHGRVWWEWVHYRWIDTGFGGWEYARWVPERRYIAGERRQFPSDNMPVLSDEIEEQVSWEDEQRRLRGGPAPEFYSTPPTPSKCRNLRHDGPTPCWHPHCSCMDQE